MAWRSLAGVRWASSRASYSRLNDKHIQVFERLLGKSRVLKDEEDVAGYTTDWFSTKPTGEGKLVLRPKTVDEVSAVMKICSEGNLAVCPQGGNTGLVGGSVPVFDEIVLSMSLMNKIISVNSISGTVSCEAGCVLEAVNSHVEKSGLMMPYDLGSKGSCQIGGNISTCAGGLRLIRYGSLNANLLGIQAVLANGDVLECMSGHRKDNTGYHLRQLFLGAEGTLGVVTGAVINCPTLPNSVSLAFLGLNSYEDVMSTFVKCRQMLAETLASCEMMDAHSMDEVVNRLGLRCPLDGARYPFYMVVETHASRQDHDEQNVRIFLEECLDTGIVQDGTLSSEPSKMREMWKVRERCVEAQIKSGHLFTYDVTLPHRQCYDIVLAMKKHLKNDDVISVSGYGHIGDGNIHLNIVAPQFSQSLLEKIEPFVYEWIFKHGGSMSSEHGIGHRKASYLHYAKTPQAVQLMRRLKETMDPKGILNPYKVLPPQ